MIQGEFFPEAIKKITINKIKYGPVKIETLLTNIAPNKYILYPTGGYHYFSKIPNAPEKYKNPIWPYVKNKTTGNKIVYAQITPNISFGGYPAIGLMDKYGASSPYQFHRIVAKAYAPNPDPLNKIYVAHLNDEVCNYLPENLAWLTSSENHKGQKSVRKSTYQQFYDFFRAQEWVKD